MARPFRMDLVVVTVTPILRGRVLIDKHFLEPIGDDIEGEPISFKAQVSTAGNVFHPMTPSRQGDTQPGSGHIVYRVADSAKDDIKFMIAEDQFLGTGSRVIRNGDYISGVEFTPGLATSVRWEIQTCRPRAILGPTKRRRALLVHLDWAEIAQERGEVSP